LLLATDVADYLVGKGLPFRRAHELVGAMTRRLLAENRDFESLPLSEWRGYSELFEADVIERVTTRASVAARRTPQSTHPDAVQASLREMRDWLGA
jgi:argininosuccinate lyase